jgi:hypothetical protein
MPHRVGVRLEQGIPPPDNSGAQQKHPIKQQDRVRGRFQGCRIDGAVGAVVEDVRLIVAIAARPEWRTSFV